MVLKLQLQQLADSSISRWIGSYIYERAKIFVIYEQKWKTLVGSVLYNVNISKLSLFGRWSVGVYNNL